MAGVACVQGAYEAAAWWLGVTETLFKAAGFDLVAADRIEYERVRCALEADIVEAAWASSG
jgi:hypothetical protein